jgi:histidinol-phosphate aminotransferase
MDVLSLVRENIINLKPYSTARDEFKGGADVYLDANENPFPSAYNRYPDPLQLKLKSKIASLKSVKPEQIFLGNGSDEAIDLLIRAFCEPGKDSILITEPTYGMYSVCAGINNVAVKKVLLTSDFDLDLEAIHAKRDATVKIIFLCSPNNPSGNALSKNKILNILQTSTCIVVIDEAYIDFSDDPGFRSELSVYPNLVILQTLSKAWGLAGLRLGMAFANPQIIAVLNKIKYPYNINIATQQLVEVALENTEKVNEHIAIILSEREKFKQELVTIDCVEHIYPSDANFLLVKVDQAKAIYTYLINQGIIVRDRSSVVLCDHCLRITIGTPEENKIVLSHLRKIKRNPLSPLSH